jgi:hypothetical protein
MNPLSSQWNHPIHFLLVNRSPFETGDWWPGNSLVKNLANPEPWELPWRRMYASSFPCLARQKPRARRKCERKTATSAVRWSALRFKRIRFSGEPFATILLGCNGSKKDCVNKKDRGRHRPWNTRHRCHRCKRQKNKTAWIVTSNFELASNFWRPSSGSRNQTFDGSTVCSIGHFEVPSTTRRLGSAGEASKSMGTCSANSILWIHKKLCIDPTFVPLFYDKHSYSNSGIIPTTHNSSTLSLEI